jgi:hypothetical protein
MTDSLRLRAGYIVFGVAAWVAFRLLGLRRSVVRGNLARSFPDWSRQQIRDVEREFVRRQGEVAAEVLCSKHIGADELRAADISDLGAVSLRTPGFSMGLFNPSQPQAGSEGREPRGHRKVSMKAAISCKTISEASR